MASLQSEYFFPHFPPPPSPAAKPPSPPHSVSPPLPSPTKPSRPPPHIIVPPPSPPHLVPPPPHALPPSPHTIPPPPPHTRPPPPHAIPPPPPHTRPPPPPSPGNHTTIIVVVFVSCGGVFFLAFIMAALWCFLKKKRKMVKKAENVHIDEHRTVKESIVQGPHGTESVMLSVEDDIHIEEDIKKSEIENFRKGLHLNSGTIDAGGSSSSTGHHNHGQKL